ncbi:hypothetical protein PY479_15205 [Shewanella sp. A32]|uniref:hypothetical protein n=1 Tax=Shewanella sp. A32 TaxID=3031327 RepID=UPI0023B8DB54|nr:hypothetical protein [Shewanella sp. A32]MDF0535620.1 hypothetical protein [Shewanella sp. A32]
MSTSRIEASKTVIARIQSMSSEAFLAMLKEKKSGNFATAIREIVEFSDQEHDLCFYSQTVEPIEIYTTFECIHDGYSLSHNGLSPFEDVRDFQSANEPLAA